MKRNAAIILIALVAQILMALGLGACASTSEGWLEVKSVGDARVNVNYFVNRR